MSNNTYLNTTLYCLLNQTVGQEKTDFLFQMMEIEPVLLESVDSQVSRAILAQAMNMLLFSKNLDAVPQGKAYVDDQLKIGRKIVFDHGALRTVDAPNTGELPRGELAFKRILEPLGYQVAAIYPLERLKMTGRAYRHQDFPETVAQFFVSELHVDQFSHDFQVAAEEVLKSSKDRLNESAQLLLNELVATQSLPMDKARELLPVLVDCFDVRHATPGLNDYETLLAESAEMAWIATEGNSFNHATDRVADVYQTANEQRNLGRYIKETVEVSKDGRVRQTAFKAAQVERAFRAPSGEVIYRMVPGSFYEFITRDLLDSDTPQLALHFDTSNAQGIFKMTDAKAS